MTAPAISDDAVPRLPRGVRLRRDRVRDRWVLLAPERIFEIDETGAEILKRCDGHLTLAGLVASLAQTFEAAPRDIRGDIEEFLSGFAEKRVLDL